MRIHIIHPFIIILLRDRQTDRQNILHMMQPSSSAYCCHPYAPFWGQETQFYTHTQKGRYVILWHAAIVYDSAKV
jgi:hypothetical protein